MIVYETAFFIFFPHLLALMLFNQYFFAYGNQNVYLKIFSF